MTASSEQTATARLTDYVLSVKTEDLPAPVRKEALRSFVNVLGCTVGGARHAAVERDVGRRWGRSRAPGR